jgi:hypothetical protein
VTRTFFAAVAAITAFTAPAFAEDSETVFTRDGQTYAYTTSTDGDATVIEGRTMPQNDPFRLVVNGRTASGTVDGRSVRFRIAKPLMVADKTTTGAAISAN